MTLLEKVPFSNLESADNPEPRCARLLLLDTSGSIRRRGLVRRARAQGIDNTPMDAAFEHAIQLAAETGNE